MPDYVAEESSAQDRAIILRHIEQCPKCKRFLADLLFVKKETGKFAALTNDALALALKTALQKKIPEAFPQKAYGLRIYGRNQKRLGRFFLRSSSVFAATLLLTVLGGYILLSQPTVSTETIGYEPITGKSQLFRPFPPSDVVALPTELVSESPSSPSATTKTALPNVSVLPPMVALNNVEDDAHAYVARRHSALPQNSFELDFDELGEKNDFLKTFVRQRTDNQANNLNIQVRIPVPLAEAQTDEDQKTPSEVYDENIEIKPLIARFPAYPAPKKTQSDEDDTLVQDVKSERQTPPENLEKQDLTATFETGVKTDETPVENNLAAEAPVTAKIAEENASPAGDEAPIVLKHFLPETSGGENGGEQEKDWDETFSDAAVVFALRDGALRERTPAGTVRLLRTHDEIRSETELYTDAAGRAAIRLPGEAKLFLRGNTHVKLSFKRRRVMVSLLQGELDFLPGEKDSRRLELAVGEAKNELGANGHAGVNVRLDAGVLTAFVWQGSLTLTRKGRNVVCGENELLSAGFNNEPPQKRAYQAGVEARPNVWRADLFNEGTIDDPVLPPPKSSGVTRRTLRR